MAYLSETISKSDYEEMIEEQIFEGSTIVDKGFFLEVYCNLDGKYDTESSEGTSFFLYIDEEISYIDLINLFEEEGSIVNDTMTINIIPNDDILYSTEREASICLSEFRK